MRIRPAPGTCTGRISAIPFRNKAIRSPTPSSCKATRRLDSPRRPLAGKAYLASFTALFPSVPSPAEPRSALSQVLVAAYVFTSITISPSGRSRIFRSENRPSLVRIHISWPIVSGDVLVPIELVEYPVALVQEVPVV